MSILTKSAALVVTVFLTFAVYRVVSDLLASGGRVDASEAILDFLVPSVVVGLLFYWNWRHRRQAKRQSPAPRP
jgi:predicted Co/Zn/Cd cation transporter (cation efflux family)